VGDDEIVEWRKWGNEKVVLFSGFGFAGCLGFGPGGLQRPKSLDQFLEIRSNLFQFRSVGRIRPKSLRNR
jgi:hypothetical protein